jgi:hypothetical protein
MESINPETIQPQPTENAVSVFGASNDVNDFPVLKAFQQYIDAEQAKARKRMLGLSVFFVILLSLVVITFTIVIMNVSQRNQDLSDRLLDIALRERSAQPVVNVQPQAPVVQQPSPETYMKPFMEKLESLTKAVAEQKQQAPAPIVVAPQVAPQQPVELAETKRLKEELKNLQKQIDEEKAKREAEKKEEERLRKVEEHRRRLYPEYYSRQEASQQQPANFVRPITTMPTPPPQVQAPQTPVVQPTTYVRPITTLPAANQQAPAPSQTFVRPITTLPAAQASNNSSQVQIKDKELQDLVKNAKPKNPQEKTAPSSSTLPQSQKSETLKVGDGVEMILPL